MFTSQRKRSRTTLLKSTAKHSQNPKKLIDSTGIGMSIRFKDQKDVAEVREFTEDISTVPIPVNTLPLPLYTHGQLLKDVNYLNSIFNHILVMISSHLSMPPENTNMQLVKMSRQIKAFIHQNIEFKGKIDTKYRGMNDLRELAQYLGISPEELKGKRLEEFFRQLQNKEMEAQRLSKQVEQLQNNAQGSSQKHTVPSNAKILQKEKRCSVLKKAIERQNQRLSKLQQEEKNLLKRLYETQRQIVKNQHSSSAIKLKLNQAQSEKRLRAKSKQIKTLSGKQNLPLDNNKSKQRKSIRVEQSARLKLLPPKAP